MKTITILGAGKSTVSLYDYLGKHAAEGGWKILACDRDPAAISARIPAGLPIEGIALDIVNDEQLEEVISRADLVISMLPASMHPAIARRCVRNRKHMATASYVSDEMRSMQKEIETAGLIFLNEMGLDPGIDHMSAMKLLQQIRQMGGEPDSFESYCGGLIVEEDCKGNPWQYKFSWNPRNVILAGQGGMSVFRKAGEQRYIPWHRLFSHAELLDLDSDGIFDAYPNRDSLRYAGDYGMQQAHTFIRGTLRRRNFCAAWHVLVELGFTENETEMHGIRNPEGLCRALTGMGKSETFTNWLLKQGIIDEALKPHFQFLESGWENMSFRPENGTAAAMLQQWLEVKWAMDPTDRDEVVMHHKIGYSLKGKRQLALSTLRITGTDHIHTAMAKTVGLPLAMGAELILSGSVQSPGIHIPITENWYLPVLKKLENYGILFREQL